MLILQATLAVIPPSLEDLSIRHRQRHLSILMWYVGSLDCEAIQKIYLRGTICREYATVGGLREVKEPRFLVGAMTLGVSSNKALLQFGSLVKRSPSASAEPELYYSFSQARSHVQRGIPFSRPFTFIVFRMAESRAPSGVLLVGSVPLDSAREVFNKVTSALPGRLLAIPDGETGERCNYVAWQKQCCPLETVYKIHGGIEKTDKHPQSYTLDSVRPTRYDEVAVSSYGQFKKLQETGSLPQDLRFQVCMPTPINSVQGWIRPEYAVELEPFYEQRIHQALENIVKDIPAADLAIQWDLTFDIIAMEFERGRLQETYFKVHFSPVKEGILDRASRLCEKIPPAAKLGFHLCYGDYKHKHFIEPADTSLLVELANDIVRTVGEAHQVEWVHMPVPKSRTDVAYFEPLRGLDLKGAKLFLGLVHADDEDGTRKRIAAAQSVCSLPFGVATECGMGRTPKSELDSLLRIMHDVALPVSVTKL